MAKGNDKKPKADKNRAKVAVSAYKIAQAAGKAPDSPFAKKPAR